MAVIITDKEFEDFRILIYNRSGLHFSATNRSILESRLRERLKYKALESVSDYYALLKANESELRAFLDSVTTNLTRFFRNAGHFETFKKHVLPDIIDYKNSKHERTLKLWSAGCSTGEEPYSFAMVLLDELPGDLTFEITGSDLSLKSLMTANEGFYLNNRVEGVPEYYLNKYMEKKSEGFKIKDEVKRTVKFDYHNLKYDSGLSGIDILICRNVLIYFDAAAQQEVMNRFWQVMADHSFLFIGHSESLFGMDTKFEFVKTEWGTLYRKPDR